MVSGIEKRAQSGGVNTAGGFLVPSNTVVRFWDSVIDDWLLSRVTLYEESDGSSSLIVVENQSAVGSWVAEGAAITPVDAVFSQLLTGAFPKLVASSEATLEYLQDAVPAGGMDPVELQNGILVRRVQRGIAQGIVNGTGGSDQPVGLFNASAGLEPVTGAISLVNLSSLYSKVHPIHVAAPNCAWVMNPTVFKTIVDLPIPPSWLTQENGILYMLGKPIYQSPYAPASQVVFGNLAYYGFKRLPGLFTGIDMTTKILDGIARPFVWFRGNGSPVVSANSDHPLAILKPA